MFKLREVITVGLLAGLLGLLGCDRVATGELQVGQTVADMREKLQEPAAIYRDGDREIWEYPFGPAGVRTYMITVDSKGVIEKIDQVLVEANFRRIQPGMSAEQVRRVLGRRGEEQRFGMTPNEVTHKYKFNNGQEDVFFTVTYNADMTVKGTGYDHPKLYESR